MDPTTIQKTRALRLVRRLRERAYPPIADYLDGVVKTTSPDPVIQAEGKTQMAAYCAACLRVKQAHPKPQ